MKCIKCGAEVKAEFKMCPYCGEPIQMVPDYNIYDEDDINIIIEGTVDSGSITKPIQNEDLSKSTEQKKQLSEEEAKKQRMKITIGMVIGICVVLIVTGVVVKFFINNSNNNSYSYQKKMADSAMFKGDLDEAEEYYLKALELEPKDVDVRLCLAELYIDKEDTDTAIQYLNDVIKYDSENYEAYKMLFKIYSEMDDTDAILALKEGVTDSKILLIFSDYDVVAPTLSLKSGTYSDTIRITISAKKDVEIYYTLDGKDPIKNGILYTETIKIEEAGSHTIQVVGKNSNGVYSDVVTETYVIEYEAPADPSVTPNGGTFTQKTYITVSVPSGCSAYYTWDQTTPTTESSLYVSPIEIPEGYNILSVIIVDNKTGLQSSIYRSSFEYIVDTEVVEEAAVEEAE